MTIVPDRRFEFFFDRAEYYHNADGQCMLNESFFGGKPPLDISWGYAVVLGFGAFFAVFTSWLVSSRFVTVPAISYIKAQLRSEKLHISPSRVEGSNDVTPESAEDSCVSIARIILLMMHFKILPLSVTVFNLNIRVGDHC